MSTISDQVPEMAARHDLGRVTDVCRGLVDGGASGHQFIDPDTVRVLSIGDRVVMFASVMMPIG
jgi:hypothetical protein